MVRYSTREEAAKAQDALDENRLGYKRSEYEKYEVKKQIIRKGDVISLKDILFTKNRDYLVKNNKERVKAEHLEDKVVVIYFLPL